MTYKVLITTSGIGSRLGDITKFTNKSLVRVGDKPAISHIIENYPEDIPFVITLGHFGSHVREFLTISYPNRVFEFVEIENFNGHGSSLGNSLSHAKALLQQSFIFHASDTLILGKMPKISFDSNWVAGVTSNDASDYTSFDVAGINVSKFHKKGMIDFDRVHIGLIGIKDHQSFWNNLEKILADRPEDSTINDVDVLQEMKNSGCQLTYVDVDNWFDTGNAGSLLRARRACEQAHDVLEKENESVFFVDGSVVKFFGDAELNKKRVSRAKMLTGLVPPIIDSTNNFFKYSFQEGIELSKLVSESEISELLLWAKENLWLENTRISAENFKQVCAEFYLAKSQRRIRDFLDKNAIKDEEILINGQSIPSVKELLESVDFSRVADGIPSGFHGDFILDNILKSGGGYVLLDWRQDFGWDDLSTGDMYYDLAKLNHSFYINHEIVSDGNFMVKVSGMSVVCDIFRKQSQVEGQVALQSFLDASGLSKSRVEILTSIIWLNMTALHHHPFDQFLYYFGRYHLWKALRSKDAL